MADHFSVKLGGSPKKHDPRTLALPSYVNISTIPEPPEECDNTRGITDFGMMLNGPNSYANKMIPPDKLAVLHEGLGCCTCAGIAHMFQVAVMSQIDEGARPAIIHPDDGSVLALYAEAGGYNAMDRSTDRGCVELDVLKIVQKSGFMGRKIEAFVSVDPTDMHQLRLAVWLFGCVYNGFALPMAWQGNSSWDIERGHGGAPASWGYHCTVSVKFDKETVPVITWGEVQNVTNAGMAAYATEAYAVVLDGWTPPNGFDHNKLLADLDWVKKA